MGGDGNPVCVIVVDDLVVLWYNLSMLKNLFDLGFKLSLRRKV